jgi:hypothetical protein
LSSSFETALSLQAVSIFFSLRVTIDERILAYIYTRTCMYVHALLLFTLDDRRLGRS